MTWVRIEDSMMEHPKILEAGADAACVHLWGLCYSSRHLTDGYIPRRALAACEWLPLRWRQRLRSVDRASVVRRLVDNGLWHVEANGFRINDFLEYNPSKADVQEKRRQTADRVKRWRAGGNAVTNASRNAVGNAAPSPPIYKDLRVTPLQAPAKGPDTADRLVCPEPTCGMVKRTRRQLLEHQANVHDDQQAWAELNQLDADMLPAVDEPA